MNVRRSFFLIFDQFIIMKQIIENFFFQHCFDNSFNHVVKVLNHSKEIFEYDFESLECKMHCKIELKYIDLFFNIKQRNKRVKIDRINDQENDRTFIIYHEELKLYNH